MQGFRKNPRAPSARSGCEASLHRTENHSWIVTRIISEHNHALSSTCGEKKQWGSHGYIDPMTKEFIKRLRRNNVALRRVCSIIGVLSAESVVPIRKQSVKSLCARMAQEDIQDDMKNTMEVLGEMKEADPEMEVRFKTDPDGRIESMLWCTGKNKIDYRHFGDVVTFDTTYRTNLYNLPFGIFVGVNNHYQSIIFGGVLLNHERTEDFEWTFRNFVEIMDGKQPQTILTGQIFVPIVCVLVLKMIGLNAIHHSCQSSRTQSKICHENMLAVTEFVYNSMQIKARGWQEVQGGLDQSLSTDVPGWPRYP